MQRQWVECARPLRVAHLNCLADECANGFTGVSEEQLKWENRRDSLLATVLEHSPDVISLVEACWMEEFWVPQMRLADYMLAGFVQKDGMTRKHGVAVFYKIGVLSVRDSPKKMTDGVAALAIQFRQTRSNKTFQFVTMHLKAKDAKEEREAQLKLIFPMISGIVPRIVTGDFNTTQSAGELIGLPDRSNLPVFLWEWTTWKERLATGVVKRAIDHFFLSKHVVPVRFLDCPFNVTEPLLSAGYPSDHLLIVMDVIIG